MLFSLGIGITEDQLLGCLKTWLNKTINISLCLSSKYNLLNGIDFNRVQTVVYDHCIHENSGSPVYFSNNY